MPSPKATVTGTFSLRRAALQASVRVEESAAGARLRSADGSARSDCAMSEAMVAGAAFSQGLKLTEGRRREREREERKSLRGHSVAVNCSRQRPLVRCDDEERHKGRLEGK